MQPAIHPRTEDLAEIAVSVFSTMLGLEFQEGLSVDRCPTSPHMLTATVQLAGEWKGAVLLHCQEAQAREFAARFLSMPPPDSVDDDVRDVLGELANMIAGNLKCTLRPGIRLSVPCVVDGYRDSFRSSGTVICELSFQTDSGPFWLIAVESSLN
jgi:chemotaxis protein CheX